MATRVIGLTGGVGMGKTTVADRLEARGIPIVDTDRLAREVVAPGQPALKEIVDAFGPDSLDGSGALDRARMAEVVFRDPESRLQLEAIVHPRIRDRWLAEARRWAKDEIPIGVIVIPLLYETGAEKEVDSVWCAACTESSQRARLLERGWTEDDIRRRIEAQRPIEEKIARASGVVWCEGPVPLLDPQVDRLLNR